MIGGLILAAGAGRRFGAEPKLLADFGGRPLLEHAIRAQCAVADLERIVVVLGAHADELSRAVDFGRAQPIVCPDWRAGLASSLRFGLAELGQAEKVVVTLGDQPLMTAEAIARLVREPPGTRACYHGVPGHPVVLGPRHAVSLRGSEGDRGAGELIRGGPTIECAGLGCGRDVDTPQDLEAIQALRGPSVFQSPVW